MIVQIQSAVRHPRQMKLVLPISKGGFLIKQRTHAAKFLIAGAHKMDFRLRKNVRLANANKAYNMWTGYIFADGGEKILKQKD